jgi:hypothetical protein
MTDIKELALKVAIDVGVWTVEPSEVCFTEARLTYFATRLIAAYVEGQEPRGWWNPSYPALSIQLTKPYDGGGWEPFFTAPHLLEPAPQQETVIDTPVDPASPPAVCAVPSSEEVREMVERLRDDETDLFRLQEQAADLIERLAARIPAGCVVVGYLDGRDRFFYADDPHMEIDHTGMREVFTAGEVLP